MNTAGARREAAGYEIEIGGDGGASPGISAAQLACGSEILDHMERTGEVAAVLATRAGFPAGRVERLRRTARLHDIGKAMVDPEILAKSATLDPEELAEVRRHTSIGHRILALSGEPDAWLSALIALTHHEHFDGSGYPAGLCGDQIPIESRIVAVADAFDALLSDRPYRRAVPFDDALELIDQGSGTHLDPKIADLALAEPEALIAARR
jgi:HD-GYP domain-containing protein (c-di-GMP phosphodiesterase class II)